MKLQILVPQYKETEDIIKPLLDSIEIQQAVDLKNDVGVIIVNDGTDVILSNDFLNRYTYKIEYHLAEHNGVSATRNRCLDFATADYVMFCDADDMFYNACGLYIIFRDINGDGFDTFSSIFIEESREQETNKPLYINRERDSTFVHGKVHRRQFLIDNNIRWNDSLTIHEDSYFNCLCQKLSKKFKYCPTSFYLWKWRDDSVCRHDPKYILKTYNNLLDSNEALIDQFISRDKENIAQFYAVSMIYDAYFTMNKDEWLNQENHNYRMHVEHRFAKYWKKYKELHDNAPTDIKNNIIVGIRNRMYKEGMILETQTFGEWIKIIEALE